MEKLEKVMNGLDCCINHGKETPRLGTFVCDYKNCTYEHYVGTPCFRVLIKDALELLKAREPRMMKLDEIKDGEPYWLSTGKEFAVRPVICVCREDDARKPYITFKWQFGELSLEAENCGKTWFCWTSQPTDEQQEKVKWE